MSDQGDGRHRRRARAGVNMPNRLRRSLLPGVLEVNTLNTGRGAEEGGLGLFKGEAGHGEHERQLRKLGDGTGELVVAVDDNHGDEVTVAMMTITITTIKVTAELERIRCALQSRDDEVEALRREVGELIETLKDNDPPPPFDLRP